jgi:4-amino-4-deoxy-L-arabinose transferase-like glycosyltransferase
MADSYSGPRRHLPLLVLGAILALAAFVHYTTVTRSVVALGMSSDGSDYFSYAYNLRRFGVYSRQVTWAGEMPPGGVRPDSLRTPGYPLLLLAIPGLDTSVAWLAKVERVQAVLGVASVLLVFLLSRRFLPVWGALGAALLTAISPHLAVHSTHLLSETLFLFLLLASMLASLAALRTGSTTRFALAGLAWGLCCLVRPTVLALPPVLLLAAWISPRLRAWRGPALVLLAVFIAVQSPWFLRNRLTPMDPEQGNLLVYSLHHGSYPNFMYQGRPETLGWPFRADPASLDAERDLGSVLRDIAGKFRAKPLAMLRWYLLGKPGTFLSWAYIQGHDIYVYELKYSPYDELPAFAGLRKLALVLHWPLMLAGLAAAVVAWLRPRWLRLEGEALVAARAVAAVVLYAVAFHMVVAPFPRYGVPFRPLLYALALAWPAALFARLAAGRGG